MAWGVDNKTTFEPKKNTYVFISQRKTRLDCSGLVMGGKPVKAVEEMELVGFVLDKRLRRDPMIDKVVKKARIGMAGLRRLRTALDDKNMKTMYLMFIRSILEYGSILYMGAAKSHLDKLDRVQTAAEKLGNFKVESLQSRREAAAMSMGLKLLDGKGRGQLQLHALVPITNRATRFSRHSATGLQLKSKVKAGSLEVYRKGFHGLLTIFNMEGNSPNNHNERKGERMAKRQEVCSNFLTGKIPNVKHKKRVTMKDMVIIDRHKKIHGLIQEINDSQALLKLGGAKELQKCKKISITQ